MKNIYSLLKQSLLLRVVCIIEILILIFVVSQCLRPACNVSISADGLVSSDSDQYVVNLCQNENVSYYMISNTEVIDSAAVLTSDTFELYPGSYNVKITYVSDTASDEESSFANSTGNLTMSSASHGSFFYFNSL